MPTDNEKAMLVLTSEEEGWLCKDYMAKHLEEQSVLMMRRHKRQCQDPIDIIVAAIKPENHFIGAVAHAELDQYGVTWEGANRAADYVRDNPGFKGRDVVESFTPAMIEMLAALHDDYEAHLSLVESMTDRPPVWNWTRQLVRHAMLSNSDGVRVLRGEN